MPFVHESAAQGRGRGLAVVDAVSNDDLLRLGPALKGMPLVTAGSGVAIALPGNFRMDRALGAGTLPGAQGLQAVVSGSCSLATNRQVQAFVASGRPAMALDPLELAQDEAGAVTSVLEWAQARLEHGPVLVYSTADPVPCRPCSNSWVCRRPVSGWSARWLPSRAVSWRWVCGNWWWPVAKHPVPACRRSTSAS
jgi:uncharacterized protein YgbK (DUF1537 family)